MTNDQNFEELEIAGEDLIDDYIHGALSPDECKLVEKGLRSSPQMRAQLHFARLLANAAAAAVTSEIATPVDNDDSITHGHESGKKSWWRGFLSQSFMPAPVFRFGLAVAVLVILIGGIGLMAAWIGLRRESDRLAQESARVEQQRRELERLSANQQGGVERLNVELQTLREQRDSDRKQLDELERALSEKQKSTTPLVSSIASILLLSGSTRAGAAGQELSVKAGTALISLNLAVEANDYPAYHVRIRDAKGSEIFKRSGLKPLGGRDNKTIKLLIPARLFPPAYYFVHLDGSTSSGSVESVDDYSFRVIPKD
jgi:hypothetical protein